MAENSVKYAMNHQFPLKIPQLDADPLRVVGISDESYNKDDFTSQLGHICFLTDSSGGAVTIS